MSTKVTYDYSKAMQFIGEQEIKSMCDIVENAKEVLVSKSGAGNDFLGWIDLPVDYDKEAFPTVTTVSKSNDGNGYVVMSTFSGAQGSITMACGVGTDLKCTGISIIEHSETSGLGAVAASTSADGVAFALCE